MLLGTSSETLPIFFFFRGIEEEIHQDEENELQRVRRIRNPPKPKSNAKNKYWKEIDQCNNAVQSLNFIEWL